MPAPEESRLHLRFEPAAYYVSPGGDIKLPRSSGGESNSIPVEAINMDEPHLAPMGELEVWKGRWGGRVRGFWLSSSEQSFTANSDFQLGELAFAPGDTGESSLDFGSLAFEARYAILDNPQRPRTDRPGYVFRTRIELLAGLRLYDLDWSVSDGSSSTGYDGSFFEPFGGAKFSLELYEQVDIDLQVSLGGWGGGDSNSFTYEILVGFTWRPIENLGVQVGYQRLGFTLEDGENDDQFEFDGAMSGLYFGAVFQF